MARDWEDVKADMHDNVYDPLPERLAAQLQDRDEETRQLGQWFTFAHLKGNARHVSRLYATLFSALLSLLPDGPQFHAMAWKLIEAKDCAVRHTIASHPEDKLETPSSD